MKHVFTLIILLSCTLAMAQLPVSQVAENKKIVLEEYAGVHCQYCPDGHRISNQMEAAHPGEMMVINVHTGQYANPGPGEPDFRTDFGSALAGQTNLSGYPSGTINRHMFSVVGPALNRGDWTSAGNTIVEQSSYVNVALEADIDVQTRIMTVDVEVYYTGNAPVSSNYLNLVLTQSNIKAVQEGVGDNPAQLDPDGVYIHNHALRDMITGQWGEEITTVTSGTLVNKTYSYTIPAAYRNIDVDLGELEVVAFVAESQQEIISGNYYHPTISNFPDDTEAGVDELHVPLIDCDNQVEPFLTVRNNGNDEITTLKIEYSSNGGPTATYDWSGNILPGHTAIVEVPGIDFEIEASNSVDLEITKVNGIDDASSADNRASGSFNELIEYEGQTVHLLLRTDQWATETSWKFTDSDGNVLYDSPNYPDLNSSGVTTRNYDFNVPAAGCYFFEMADSYGDGICSGYGNGSFTLSVEGTTILTGCDFDVWSRTYFTLDPPPGFALVADSLYAEYDTIEASPMVYNMITPRSTPMTLKWILTDVSVPNGWTDEVIVCDNTMCHASTVTENQYTLTENEATDLNIQFLNNHREGMGSATLLVYDLADSAGTAEYVEYYINVINIDVPSGFVVAADSVFEEYNTTEADPTVHNILTPNAVPMTLRWHLVELTVPAGWTSELAICDDVECHVSSLTSYEYTVTETGATVLDAHFINNNLPGDGYAKLLVYDVNDSAATAKYVEYYLTINDATGLFEQSTGKLDVYPNPVSSELRITGLEGVNLSNIDVFNAAGAQVLNIPFNHSGEQMIDVSSLKDGLYLIRMYDKAKDLWMTQSFMKQ
ncbi:MAG: Omp28-related outer membrane protein [Bacteroidetes bacterium]|nr:Omp28-related outer membrane protein [Bacteroidota bacterium]